MNALTFIILSLSAYRITHLLVFDKIFDPFRRFFVTRQVIFTEHGPQFYFTLSQSRIRAGIGRVLNCPWCCGVWVAVTVTLLYHFFPMLYLALVILAVAGAIGLIETAWMKSVGMPEMREKKPDSA